MNSHLEALLATPEAKMLGALLRAFCVATAVVDDNPTKQEELRWLHSAVIGIDFHHRIGILRQAMQATAQFKALVASLDSTEGLDNSIVAALLTTSSSSLQNSSQR